MKKIIFSIFSLIMVFTACNRLDLLPEDYYAIGNFWNSKAQVDGFIVGLHGDMRNAYTSLYYLGEARGGTSKHGNSTVNTSLDSSSPIKDQDFTKDKTGVSNWNGYYGKLLQVNLLIQEVENGCKFLTDDERNYILGQGYGLRAFYYFMLYRTYGGVPIIKDVKVINGVTSAKELYNARTTPAQTLTFIKDDINKSDTYFGTNFTINGNRSMWSKAATLVLKAEIYLWSAKVTTGDQSPATDDLQKAKSALIQLEGKYSLMPQFTDVFNNAKKGNDEIIFAFRFIDGEATNWAGNFISADNLFISQVYGRDGKLITKDTLNTKGTGILRHEYKFSLFESFDDLDTRRDATFFDFYIKDNSGTVVNKGLVLKKALGSINSNNVRVYDSDIPLYRYADVLLMLAEVENMQNGDPAKYINMVRKRAYGSNYNSALHDYANSTFEQNELAILHERDKEFVWEGKRWFDVVRMQDANGRSLAFSAQANYLNYSETTLSPILNYTTEAYKLLWPINVGVITNDPTVEQTPGYGTNK